MHGGHAGPGPHEEPERGRHPGQEAEQAVGKPTGGAMEYHFELAIVGPDETAGGQSQGEYACGVALAQRGAFVDEWAVLFKLIGGPRAHKTRCPRR